MSFEIQVAIHTSHLLPSFIIIFDFPLVYLTAASFPFEKEKEERQLEETVLIDRLGTDEARTWRKLTKSRI